MKLDNHLAKRVAYECRMDLYIKREMFVICACYLPLFGENNIRYKIEIFMCQPKNELNASLWRHNIWAHILNAWNRNELFAPVINCVQFYHVS